MSITSLVCLSLSLQVAPSDDINRLIRSLGDHNYVVRHAATAKLTDMGRTAYLACRWHMKHTDDPEIYRRCQMVAGWYESATFGKIKKFPYLNNGISYPDVNHCNDLWAYVQRAELEFSKYEIPMDNQFAWWRLASLRYAQDLLLVLPGEAVASVLDMMIYFEERGRPWNKD